MKEKALEFLRCPCCTENLYVAQVLDHDEDEILNGLVKCQCNEYPILKGILILDDNKYSSFWKSEICEYIKNKDRLNINKCIELALSGKAVGISWLKQLLLPTKLKHRYLINKIIMMIIQKKIPFYRLSACNFKYSELIDDPYFLYRFSSDTFWLARMTIPIMGMQPEIIIDVGCGAGHSSFLIENIVKPKMHFCIDGNFRFLLATKLFCALKAQCIQYDLNFPLPFDDKIASGVFTLDVLHYIHHRYLAINELQRILDDHGILIALHLHNSSVYNPSAGEPLPAHFWISMFNKVKKIVYTDAKLIEDFLADKPMDLSFRCTDSVIDRANAISIIATRSDNMLSQIKPIVVDPYSFRGVLIINPLYDIKRFNDQIVLRRRSSDSKYFSEFPYIERVLPESYTLKTPFTNMDRIDLVTALSLLDERHYLLEELLRKFIFLVVPDQYI